MRTIPLVLFLSWDEKQSQTATLRTVPFDRVFPEEVNVGFNR